MRARCNSLIILTVVALGGPLVLAGCRASTASAAGPTSLHVVRSDTLPGNSVPPLDQTVNDAAAIGQLYAIIQVLPAESKLPIPCPADFGVQYELTFSVGGAQTQDDVAHSGGCRILTIGANDNRQTNDAFWAQLAKTLGISESDLFVIPTTTP